MKLPIVILTLILISCTKENIQPSHHCELCIEVSDKYATTDTLKLLRTDTLFMGRLCDSTLQAFKTAANSQPKDFNLCSIGLLEKRKFIYKP